MARTIRIWSGLAVVTAALLGCTGQHTETREFGDVAASVTVQPYPMRVGKDTEVYVTLRRHREGVSGCKVRERHYDTRLVIAAGAGFRDMPEQGRSGIYRVRVGGLDTPGQLRLELQLECGDVLRPQRLMFQYEVATAA